MPAATVATTAASSAYASASAGGAPLAEAPQRLLPPRRAGVDGAGWARAPPQAGKQAPIVAVASERVFVVQILLMISITSSTRLKRGMHT